MALNLYNSYTKRLEEFKSIKKNEVSMYNCGPTVYNYAHIGNWRSFLFADLLKRFLKFKGYSVKQIMNITDVGHLTSDADEGEDKMEKSASTQNKTPEEIAQFYEKAFFQDLAILNIDLADKYPKATDHIKEMIKLVETLIEKDYAYESNGSVYFDVTKFENYGKLSGNTLGNLQSGKRIAINKDKKNPHDFALWVYNPKHLMFWKSPWNDHGYPGWHLECSAMSIKYLGEHFDIHTGGEDNKFPHHECEIAQSESATGKQWVNYWLHSKFLLVEGEKMSKSLGNFYTLRDLVAKNHSAESIRYLLISTHYRQQLNFTFKGLSDSQKAVDKIVNFVRSQKETDGSDDARDLISQTRLTFEESLDDDLNISQALATIFEFIREINKLDLNKKSAELATELIFEFDSVLGLDIRKLSAEEISIPTEIQDLLEERQQARDKQDWDKSDQLRDKIKSLGWQVEDTADGQKIDQD